MKLLQDLDLKNDDRFMGDCTPGVSCLSSCHLLTSFMEHNVFPFPPVFCNRFKLFRWLMIVLLFQVNFGKVHFFFSLSYTK